MKRKRWVQRIHKLSNFTLRFLEPYQSNDYWVTDGWYVHIAHYDKDSDSWGIYQPDRQGINRRCIHLDDMNFNIVGWCEMDFPTIPVKYQEI